MFNKKIAVQIDINQANKLILKLKEDVSILKKKVKELEEKNKKKQYKHIMHNKTPEEWDEFFSDLNFDDEDE